MKLQQNAQPIFEALQKFGEFKVFKGQEVLLSNGDVRIISEDKTITKKDFGVPVEDPYSPLIPKCIISISK